MEHNVRPRLAQLQGGDQLLSFVLVRNSNKENVDELPQGLCSSLATLFVLVVVCASCIVPVMTGYRYYNYCMGIQAEYKSSYRYPDAIKHTSKHPMSILYACMFAYPLHDCVLMLSIKHYCLSHLEAHECPQEWCTAQSKTYNYILLIMFMTVCPELLSKVELPMISCRLLLSAWLC